MSTARVGEVARWRAGPIIAESRVTAGLRRLCASLRRDLRLHSVSVTVMAGSGHEALVAGAGSGFETAERLHFDLGEGPSLDAFAEARPHLVDDLAAADGRWPLFVPAARSLGVTAVYAVPLGVGATPLGVLTCNASKPLDAEAVVRCLATAATATALLLRQHPRNRTPARLDPQVPRSLRIRDEVYQAQGMLSAALGIDLDDALARLRAVAFAEGIDVNSLVHDLVTGRRPVLER